MLQATELGRDQDDWNMDSSDLGDPAFEPWTEPVNFDTTFHKSNSESLTLASRLGHSRTIVHIDIDCFYAQVEMLRNPELKTKPLGIQQKNIVVTSNYVARNFGVPKSCYIAEAKKICPDLVLVCGEDLTNYRQMSHKISEFLQKYTTCVERLGFDENFVDVSELVTLRLNAGKYTSEFIGHVYGSDQTDKDKLFCDCGCKLGLQIGSQIAADMREALDTELGITSCAGIAHNKLLAKLVAGNHKPNQQTTLPPHWSFQFVTLLPSVLHIPGIGYKTSKKLASLGIASVIDLQKYDWNILIKEFGSSLAQTMVHFCHAIDDSPVVTFSKPQTMSDEDAFTGCKDVTDAQLRIKSLLSNLLPRVLEDGRIPKTLRLTIRRVTHKHQRESRQCPIPANTFTKNSAAHVMENLLPVLMTLFSRLVDTTLPFHLTLIGISFANLVERSESRGNIHSFLVKRPSPSNQDKTSHAIIKKSTNQDKASDLRTKISSNQDNASDVRTLITFNQDKANYFSTETSSNKYKAIDVNTKTSSSHNNASDVNTKTSSNHYQANDLYTKTFPTSSHNELIISQPDPDLKKNQDFEVQPDLKACKRNIESPPSSTVSVSDESNSQPETSSFIKSLQLLLPDDVDAHTVAELPLDVQKEVLLHYGINMKGEGVASKLIDRRTTRSYKAATECVTGSLLSPVSSWQSKKTKPHSAQSQIKLDFTPKRRKLEQKEKNSCDSQKQFIPQNALTSQSMCIIQNTSTLNIVPHLTESVVENSIEDPTKMLLDAIDLPRKVLLTAVLQQNSENNTESDQHQCSPENNQTSSPTKPSDKDSCTLSCLHKQPTPGQHPQALMLEETFSANQSISSSPEKIVTKPAKPSSPEKSVTKPAKPFSPEKSVTKPAKPSSAEKSVTKSAKPSSPEKSVKKSAKPSSPEKSVTKPAKPSSPEKSVTKPAKPSSAENSVTKSAKPSSTEKSVTKSAKPSSPEKSVTKPAKPSSPKSVTKSAKPSSTEKSVTKSAKSSYWPTQNLPSTFDSEVFASLPGNIRGEIMAHVMMGTSFSDQSEPTVSAGPVHNRNENRQQRHPNTLLSYFSRH